jgi:hypothetical protein
MTPILALLGAKALYVIFVWLGSAALAGWLADRKGYPERWGLASGLILLIIGPIIWLVVPARRFDTPAAKDD